ncbi:hypothetical protein HII31_10898 [Pseudocercospora fuligena]|uniref:Uncharacterized protein n=1 Tax=Pseudocercospora fuligena TaxID=685502 RepID=A0A8H6RC67_9PEZI|nr:hypothetical protein HII31_10898 [Pseudocercospora fuligena]
MESGNAGLVTVDNHLVSQKNARSALPPTVAPEDADTESDSGSEASSIDPGDFAMLSKFMDMDPNRTVTDEQAKEAFKRMKKTPLHKMPPASRELFEDMKADGVDLSGGFMAMLRHEIRKHSGLTTAHQQELMKTTTLEDYNRLFKKFHDDESSDEPKANSSDRSLAVDTPLETISQTPIIGKKHWLTTGPKNKQEWSQYAEARRRGKMIIDGEEFTMNFSLQTTFNPTQMSAAEREALVDKHLARAMELNSTFK